MLVKKPKTSIGKVEEKVGDRHVPWCGVSSQFGQKTKELAKMRMDIAHLRRTIQKTVQKFAEGAHKRIHVPPQHLAIRQAQPIKKDEGGKKPDQRKRETWTVRLSNFRVLLATCWDVPNQFAAVRWHFLDHWCWDSAFARRHG